MKPRAIRPVNASHKAGLLATGSCVALLTACAGTGPFATGSSPYAGDVEPSTVRPASIEDYPNLADVPPRPADLPDAAERQALRDALEGDREAGRLVETSQVPAIASDLADVAGERPASEPMPQVAESLSPEPIGAEQGRDGTSTAAGPLIVDAEGLAEATQPLEVEELADEAPMTVAEAEIVEEEQPRRRGFFARLFGGGEEAATEAAEDATAVAEAPPVPAAPSNGELMLPQREEPAAAVAEVPAAPLGEDLMLPQHEEPAPEVAAAPDAPLGEDLMLPQAEEPARTMVAQSSPGGATVHLPEDAPVSAEMMFERNQAAEIPEGVVAVVGPDLMVPQAEEPMVEEAPAVAAAPGEPATMETVALAESEAPAEAESPGFFARWFGGETSEPEAPAEVSPAGEPEPQRVVIAKLSSQDPELAPGTGTGISPEEERVEVEPLEAAPAPARTQPEPQLAQAPAAAPAPAPAPRPEPVLAASGEPPAPQPMSQERARALIAAREQRETGTRPTETQLAEAGAEASSLPPLVPEDRQAARSQVAALPDEAIMPEETVVIDDKSVTIASGPIDPTIRIFQERFAQSGVSVKAPIRVAALPPGTLTTDMPPMLPRVGVIYFRPGELSIPASQRPLTQAAAAELLAGGGNLRVVAHRNAEGLPGDPDPGDAARVRLQEVIAGLMASGVASQSIVTEIASPNRFQADMDYNRRVEIYLDSATAAR